MFGHLSYGDWSANYPLSKCAYEAEDNKVSLQDQLNATLAYAEELEGKLPAFHLLRDEDVVRAKREFRTSWKDPIRSN